ncbi:transposase, IS605 OrfB family [Nocardiopsis dassonvillei]|uniref:Transposase, IS605 OrfB family n=2 Tax=Nocardiopsis dassonvillei TaxID=2014 RepID=D7AZZ4_NOCDD|nr:transposase, IS605 OrfB family [Nocardiopsis dassonvillei subsp. dassonvillei DSM 43111]VEI88769.1 transposase, IS605 OrfB family [Nocardiopsis dassonvillei]
MDCFDCGLSLAGCTMAGVSKIVVQLGLTPSPEQAAVLASTLRALNTHATRVAKVAHEQGVMRDYELRKHTYRQLRAAEVGSQAARHVIKKVCDAYRTRRANLDNGDYGPKGSVRRTRIGSTPIAFRAGSAHPYDARDLSFAMDARTISLWTFQGRLQDVPFTGSADQVKALAGHKRGEADLLRRDGAWFLAVTVEVPDAPEQEPDGFVGVDLRIINIATTSDGQVMAGRRINRYRRRRLRLRQKLQAKGTRSAKRLLRKRRRKEARHADTNHQISKRIVAEAERTGRGISLENLTGIRARVRQRRPQRATLHSWSFHQLGAFIAYKARLKGVPVVFVDPAHSSRECAACSYTHRANRVSQALFICRSCGVVAHADRNASRVLARRCQEAWNAGRKSHVPPGHP